MAANICRKMLKGKKMRTTEIYFYIFIWIVCLFYFSICLEAQGRAKMKQATLPRQLTLHIFTAEIVRAWVRRE